VPEPDRRLDRHRLRCRLDSQEYSQYSQQSTTLYPSMSWTLLISLTGSMQSSCLSTSMSRSSAMLTLMENMTGNFPILPSAMKVTSSLSTSSITATANICPYYREPCSTRLVVSSTMKRRTFSHSQGYPQGRSRP